MTVLGLLENGLFALGQVLRLPVMLALWLCVFAVVFHVGLAASASARRLVANQKFDVKNWINGGAVLGAPRSRVAELPAALSRFMQAVQKQSVEGSLQNGGLENLLAAHEEALRRGTEVPRALVKVAPSLGLLGTLIPMGASLSAMSGGDLNAMAAHMVVAFTTTIIGIAVGTVAYVVVVMRQSETARTSRQMRYLAEVVAAEIGAG